MTCYNSGPDENPERKRYAFRTGRVELVSPQPAAPVDLGGIEPPSPQCECDALPLCYRPTAAAGGCECSQFVCERLQTAIRQSEAPADGVLPLYPDATAPTLWSEQVGTPTSLINF